MKPLTKKQLKKLIKEYITAEEAEYGNDITDLYDEHTDKGYTMYLLFNASRLL